MPMKLAVQRAGRVLWTLEAALWIAGFCALFYCIFSVGGAVITQRRLAQSFERSLSDEGKAASSRRADRPVILGEAEPTVAGPTGEKRVFVASKETQPLGLLNIPRVGVSAIVLEGAGSGTLRVGLGHIPGTSRPGQPGNIAIAGHRDTFFRPLRGIQAGDEIVVESVARDFHYRVSSTEIVEPSDVDELRSHGRNELTLVTCYPFSYIGAAPKRFIVHANLAD